MSSWIRTEGSTKDSLVDVPDGYREMISEGMKCIGTLDCRLSRGRGTKEENIELLKERIDTADAIVVGAGSGLSTSAGLTYSGERFMTYFSDFHREYGITDIYSGGFFPFPDERIKWAWWSRHIYFNRYVDPPRSVYNDLLEILKDKDYFVVTTNVDHQFQRAGFDKKRLFYTQGDYGLFQSSDPLNRKTYDNEDIVCRMLESQGFVKENGTYSIPKDGINMAIEKDLIPICPDDGTPFVMNLRSDDTFVEDRGWKKASANYSDFLRIHEKQDVLYLELGVGSNTPIIIKYPFWYRAWKNPKATYACLNFRESYCPRNIIDRSICIDADIGFVLSKLKR